jgi:hypothetical protein
MILAAARQKKKPAPKVVALPEPEAHTGEATRVSVNEVAPAEDEKQKAIRQQFEQIMARRPVAMVMHAELPDGGAVTGAAGPPALLEALCRIGFTQLMDMLDRTSNSGENG